MNPNYLHHKYLYMLVMVTIFCLVCVIFLKYLITLSDTDGGTMGSKDQSLQNLSGSTEGRQNGDIDMILGSISGTNHSSGLMEDIQDMQVEDVGAYLESIKQKSDMLAEFYKASDSGMFDTQVSRFLQNYDGL